MTTPSPRNKLLIDRASKIQQKFKIAVINPISSETLAGALNAAEQGLIEPVLIGPKSKVEQVAQQIGKDITKYELIDVTSTLSAVNRAAELAKEGQVKALMKGSIHTSELMRVVVSRDAGLRTGRRVSHCLVADVPTYEKLLILTDVAINISPDLLIKKEIVQNAIDFAQALDVRVPSVALLSFVETVMPDVAASTDAAVLCKMAERGQITGGVLDGPLSIDLAISEEAAALKHFKRILPVNPDIFVVPDLNSGNITFKVLDYMAGAQSAGIVLGAKVPVILVRRSSPAVEHLISCALAKIYSHYCQQL